MPQGYRTLDGIDLNDIWYGPGQNGAGIAGAVDMYRRVDIPVLRSLAMPWGRKLIKYAISEKNGFQRLAPGQRPDRKNVQMATQFPVVEKRGYGVGTDLDTLQMSTGREITLDLNRPMEEDPELVFLLMLQVMMKDPGTANKKYGFWNGTFASEEELTTPPKFQNNSFAASHNHYYRTGAATIRIADITEAKKTIRHHGNSGALAGFINSVEQQALEDLASFTASSLTRSPVSDAVAVNGFQDAFRLLGVDWFVTEMIPAGYFLMAEFSPSESRRPLVEYAPENMAGLRLHPGNNPNYPLVESYFDRWIGHKVLNRGAGVAVQIATGSGYTDPTFNE